MNHAELSADLKNCCEYEISAQKRVMYQCTINALETAQLVCAERDRLAAQNLELEKLCDVTYVANGADAYHHACECMEAYQAKRAAAGKEKGTIGSLCDGMEWLYARLESVEAELETIRKQEPVAVIGSFGKVYWIGCSTASEIIQLHDIPAAEMLYAAPVAPVRELSDAEIRSMYDKAMADWMSLESSNPYLKFARSIIAAINAKEQQ